MNMLAKPCAKCGTTGGTLRSGGSKPVRYKGERYGYAGSLCATCRAAGMRREYAAKQGRELGKVGRPRHQRIEMPPREPRQAGQVITDTEIRAGIEAERARLLKIGLIQPTCDPTIERWQRENAERARMERQRAAERRIQALPRWAIGA